MRIMAKDVRAAFERLVLLASLCGIPGTNLWALTMDTAEGVTIYRLKTRTNSDELSNVLDGDGYLGASTTEAYQALSYLKKGMGLVVTPALRNREGGNDDVDPDAMLQKVRAARDAWSDSAESVKSNRAKDADAALKLARAVDELDDWLTGGGRPPKAWQHDA